MKKKGLLCAAVLGMSLLLSACGNENSKSSGSANNSVREEMSYDGAKTEEAAEINNMPETPDAEMGAGILNGEKLVYTCDLSMETLDYDGCVHAIKQSIAEYNGIIEDENEFDEDYDWYYDNYVKTSGTRHMHMTVRVPSARYAEFLGALEGNGKITAKNSHVENISRQYYETDAYIKSLEIQQNRLLDMMEQADTIEDMITIEARLSEVQYQLNIAKNELSAMDADVNYSTVTISVREVMEYTPEKEVKKSNTFGSRLKNTFAETWEMFLRMLEFLLFAVIRLIPVLFILAVIAGIVLGIIKLCSKKRKKKPEKKE